MVEEEKKKEKKNTVTLTDIRNPSWRGDLLGNLPSSYGRSYDERFETVMNQFGLTPEQSQGFYAWLTAQSIAEKDKEESEMLERIQNRNFSPQTSLKDQLLRGDKRYGDTDDERIENIFKELGYDPKMAKGFSEWLDRMSQPDRAEVITHDYKGKPYEPIMSTMDTPSKKAKPEKNTLWEDITTALGNWWDFVNPFDDTSAGEAVEKNVQDALTTERSGITKELNRATAQIADSATLGLLDELYKVTRDGQTSPLLENREGAAGIADMLYDMLGYGISGTAGALGLRGLGLGANANTVSQLAKEGAILGAGMTGVEEGLDWILTPEDNNIRDTLVNLGINTLGGAVLDPAISKGIEKVSKLLKKREQGVKLKPEEEAEVREFLQGVLEGQEIITDPNWRENMRNRPALDGATQSLPTPRPPELDSPNSRFGADEVNIEGTPLLNEPTSIDEIDALIRDYQNAQRVFEEEQMRFVEERLQPFKEVQERQAKAQQEWEAIKQLQEEGKRIQKAYGKIYVPEGNQADWQKQIPPRFRAGKNRKDMAYDIYQAAEEEGFPNVDEFIAYLQRLDDAMKTKLKHLTPADSMKISDDDWIQLEEAAKQEFLNTETGQALDKLLTDLVNLAKNVEDGLSGINQEGDPLRFVKEIVGKRSALEKFDEPIVGRMNPKDQVATGYRGNYRVETINSDVRRVEPIPPEEEKPLQFKRTKIEVDNSSPREAIIVEDTPNAQTLGAKAKKGTSTQPVGFTSSKVDTDEYSPIAGKETLSKKIKEGKVSLKQSINKIKENYISDLQEVKNFQRLIERLDGNKSIPKYKGTNITPASHSIYKSARELSRAASIGARSAEKSYQPIFDTLRKNKIDTKDFDEYVLAKHAKDIYEKNAEKARQAQEIRNTIEQIKDDPKQKDNVIKLEKALSELEPYILPKQATPEWVEKTLKRFEGNKVMEELQQKFVHEQRKDLVMLMEAGLYTREQIENMIREHPNYVSMVRHFDESIDSFGNRLKPKKSVKARKLGAEEQIISPLDSAIRNRINHTVQAEKNRKLGEAFRNLSKVEGIQDVLRKVDPDVETDLTNTIKLFENGKEVYYKVPPAVKNALDSLDRKNSESAIEKMVHAASTAIRKGATHWNIDFILSSVIRDTPYSMTVSRTRNANPFRGISDAVLGYLDAMFGKNLEKLSGGKIKSFKDVYIQEGGGITNYIGGHTNFISLEKGDIEKMTKVMANGKKGWRILNPLNLIEKLGETLEHGQKLAEFRSAKRAGLSDRDAMYEAVDIIDYSDQGKVVRDSLGKKIPFLSPAIRGNTRIIQAAKENPKKFLMNGFMYFTAPTVMLYGTRYADWVTEEQESKLRNLRTWEKNLFWHVPLPDGENLLAIPKAHLLAQIFANPIERVLDEITVGSNKEVADHVKETIKDFSQSLAPPMGMAGVREIIEAYTNYDFLMDMPIEDSKMQKEPDKSKRYNAYTSEVAKEAFNTPLGDLLSLTGINSPAKFDHVLKGLTGGLGRDVLDTIDNLIYELGGDRPSKTQTTGQILNPLTRFLHDETRSPEGITQLYDLAQQNPDNEDIKAINKYNQEISKLIREIREDTSLEPQEKRDSIAVLRQTQRDISDLMREMGLIK